MRYAAAASQVDLLIEIAAEAIKTSVSLSIRARFGRIYGGVYASVKDLIEGEAVTLNKLAGPVRYANAIEAAFIAGASEYESQGYLQLTKLGGVLHELADAAGTAESTEDGDSRRTSIIDPSRIAQLREVASTEFDTLRLVRLCEELNLCYEMHCFLAVSYVTRAILDHVPPIFNKNSFAEVANHYEGRSFKEAMLRLEKTARQIANRHLHLPIRDTEVLPNATQIDFAAELDVLLTEAVRLLRRASRPA